LTTEPPGGERKGNFMKKEKEKGSYGRTWDSDEWDRRVE